MPITVADLVKYPFLPKAKKYLSRLDLNLKELVSLPKIRQLAKQRVLSSISLNHKDPLKLSKNYENEISTYTLALLYISGIGEKKLTKLFAKSEGDKINQYLKNEKHQDVIFEIAKSFNWITKKNDDGSISIGFSNYLENASRGRLIHNSEWKLVNRLLENGTVRLPPNTVARLLSEEVHDKIEESITQELTNPPIELQEDINELKVEYQKRKKHFEKIIITVKAKESEYPPCISSLIKRASNGQHLSHVERFTLVTYLLHQGVEIDSIVKLFSKVSDFKEDLTRYQIENLAGKKGAMIKPYVTYNCSTLQTHNVCSKPNDSICYSIKNPLNYHLFKKNRKIRNNNKHRKTN
jgi:DNA primase large subunit